MIFFFIIYCSLDCTWKFSIKVMLVHPKFTYFTPATCTYIHVHTRRFAQNSINLETKSVWVSPRAGIVSCIFAKFDNEAPISGWIKSKQTVGQTASRSPSVCGQVRGNFQPKLSPGIMKHRRRQLPCKSPGRYPKWRTVNFQVNHSSVKTSDDAKETNQSDVHVCMYVCMHMYEGVWKLFSRNFPERVCFHIFIAKSARSACQTYR